ncbi:hypothetical protein [Pseudonocardia charpentierae]|uniref:Lipoprotein LpqN n=1 Tax=Pseudonocardia charpentierae TaxID=3075545 RepID=A0ABU2NBB5_9PSEU|nr:hypothetical protein [Pseudonocardia sp. DSM 45834]MDT0351246.1 hypothetical protein [Pseudonocardia sp. DSM 45834]
MSGTRTHSRRAGGLAVVAASALLLSGCGNAEPAAAPPAQPEPLLLSGPTTHVMVAIPTGWHQVINSANPVIPQMVAPTTCMGDNEVSCALGLVRTATTTAPTIEEAAKAVEDAVTGEPGITKGATLNQGPAKIGKRDGYRHRFTFTNPTANLTAEVAAVPSGPTTPNPDGTLEYSIVLAWVSDKPDAPKPDVIDQIVDSTLVYGGQPPHE